MLNILGFLFTSFWTNRLYNASLIKHLYKVKHTSSGRDVKPVPMGFHSPSVENKAKENPLGKGRKDVNQAPLRSSGTYISYLWERMDAVR